MRNKIGFRSFLMLALAGSLGIGVFIACGGSDPQDVIAEDAGSEASLVDTNPQPIDTGVQDTGPKDTGADTNQIIVYDSGTPTQLDGGDAGTIPCFDPGELEVESNDTANLANTLRPTVCGIISAIADAGGPDGGESDFLKFMLTDASTGYYLQFTGDVSMTIRVKNETYVVEPGKKGPVLPQYKGEIYTVEVRRYTNGEPKWSVTLFEFGEDGGIFLPDGGGN